MISLKKLAAVSRHAPTTLLVTPDHAEADISLEGARLALAADAFRGTHRIERKGFWALAGKMEAEGVDTLDMASSAYSWFKSASREEQREMAKHLLSNSTITDRNVQVCFHQAFEMILEANQEIPENAPNSVIVEKWLAN